MLFEIKKDGTPAEDFFAFVEALNIKFKFKNKEEFREDLFELATNIDTQNKNVDLQKIENKLFALIALHSTEAEFNKQFSNAAKEMENFEWQQK